ncbi:hypothetical protein ON010_g9981 [Phytophthora cinnamomi]|nr:hypothetical protein ON010_g9981 [Phytophthora cinnamomi]
MSFFSRASQVNRGITQQTDLPAKLKRIPLLSPTAELLDLVGKAQLSDDTMNTVMSTLFRQRAGVIIVNPKTFLFLPLQQKPLAPTSGVAAPARGFTVTLMTGSLLSPVKPSIGDFPESDLKGFSFKFDCITGTFDATMPLALSQAMSLQ